MFSVVAVHHYVHSTLSSTAPLPDMGHWTPTMAQPLPQVLLSGGHQSTYGWQTGSTHPAGMFSCTLRFQFLFYRNLNE